MRIALVVVMLAVTTFGVAGTPPTIERVQGSAWLKLFGATVPRPTLGRPYPLRAHLVPGAKLHRYYIKCEREISRGALTCAASDRKHLLASHADPIDGAFWTWADATFTFTDEPASSAVAKRIAQQMRKEQPIDFDDTALILNDNTEWEIVDEMVGAGCENPPPGQPCDHIVVRTGKKIRHTTHSGSLIFSGYSFAPDLAAPEFLLDLLGSGYALQSLDLLVPVKTPHEAVIYGFTGNVGTAPKALAYLETVKEKDPDMRLALAFDRAVIAAATADVAIFQTAYAALVAERKQYGTLPPNMQSAFDHVMPILDQLASGALSRTAPFGLDKYIK
jgi:hypothetical protein